MLVRVCEEEGGRSSVLHVSRVALSYFAKVNHKLLFRMQWSCRSGEGGKGGAPCSTCLCIGLHAADRSLPLITKSSAAYGMLSAYRPLIHFTSVSYNKHFNFPPFEFRSAYAFMQACVCCSLFGC